jgi:hypothetical protein
MKFDPHNEIKVESAEKPTLPYKFIVEMYEGRLKGMYPEEIRFIPHLKRKWDNGGMGTGRKQIVHEEFDTAKEVLDFLRSRRVRPLDDNVEVYKIMVPGSHRIRAPFRELERLSRI